MTIFALNRPIQVTLGSRGATVSRFVQLMEVVGQAHPIGQFLKIDAPSVAYYKPYPIIKKEQHNPSGVAITGSLALAFTAGGEIIKPIYGFGDLESVHCLFVEEPFGSGKTRKALYVFERKSDCVALNLKKARVKYSVAEKTSEDGQWKLLMDPEPLDGVSQEVVSKYQNRKLRVAMEHGLGADVLEREWTVTGKGNDNEFFIEYSYLGKAIRRGGFGGLGSVFSRIVEEHGQLCAYFYRTKADMQTKRNLHTALILSEYKCVEGKMGWVPLFCPKVLHREVTDLAIHQSRDLPLKFGHVLPDSGGNIHLKSQSRVFGFTKDPNNLYSKDLLSGDLVYLEYADRLVVGRLKTAYRGDGIEISREYRAKDPNDYMDELDTVYFLDSDRIKVADREYTGTYFNFSNIAPNFGRFEDAGLLQASGRFVSYTLSAQNTGFVFLLPLNGNNRITRLAKEGKLLMTAGVRAESIEFWDISDPKKLVLLREIQIDGQTDSIADMQGRKYQLTKGASLKLTDFWPEIAKPEYVPQVVRIEAGRRSVEIGRVDYHLWSDFEHRRMLEMGDCTLTVYEDRIELANSFGRRYVVKIDQEGYVLGSDGARYISPISFKQVRIHDPISGRAAQSLDFWSLALKEDRGVVRAAEAVDETEFARLLREGFPEDKIFALKNVRVEGNHVRINVGGQMLVFGTFNWSYQLNGSSTICLLYTSPSPRD